MRIQHNIMAMNAYRNYTNNTSALSKNLEKLSSGYRINRAGDDAAGLAISEKMRAQITALGTAQKNVKDGISLVKTAEGATQEIHDMLNRMVDLATQSANGTYQNEVDREAIEDEFNALKTEIDRIADSSNFNGIKLLDGSLGLNTDVFKIASGNAYAEATSETTSNLSPIDEHGGAAVTASPASFTVNLKELEATIATGATNKVTFTINIAGQNVTASFAGAGAAATKSATDVAAAIKAAYTGSTASKSIKIGDAYFKASNTGGVLTFTMAGYDKAGTFTAASAATAMENLSEDQVKAINDKLSTAKVSVSAAASGTATWANVNNIDHGITPTLAVAKKEGGLLGAEYDISNLLANGAKLELDDKTFTVKMGASATNGGDASVLAIDTNKYATEAEQMAKLKELLTAASTTNFNINTAAGNKISVDQKAPGAITGVKTMADVTAKLTAPGQAEQIASTKLYVTGAAEKGNVLNIGDDKITFNGGEDIDAVKSAIEGKGYTVTKETDSDGKAYLNIQGKATDADGNTIASKDITAPTVLGKGLTLQIGEDSQSYNQLSVAITDMHSESLGLNAITLKNQDGAQAAVDVIKNAINSVSSTRGKLGATQNRLEHTANNLSTMKENIQDAEATIRDTDIAEEMMAYTKNNILVQSAQAMLAQANQIPQGVLQLLG